MGVRYEKLDEKKTDTKENKINRIDYRAMYYSLFQDVTDAVKVLECAKGDHVKKAVRILDCVVPFF